MYWLKYLEGALSLSRVTSCVGQQAEMCWLPPRVGIYTSCGCSHVDAHTPIQRLMRNSHSAGKLSQSVGFRHKQWINGDLGERNAPHKQFSQSEMKAHVLPAWRSEFEENHRGKLSTEMAPLSGLISAHLFLLHRRFYLGEPQSK